jgi:hypothetical protein
LEFGADYIINSKDKDVKAIKGELKAISKEAGVPSNFGWKIFECTGVTPGQDIALGLLSFHRQADRGGLQSQTQHLHDLQAHGV